MKIEKFTGDKLPLTNSGHLSLFFVGVGSAFSKMHYQTNLLIIKGNDHVLIDFGTRCAYGLFKLGISVTDIRNFFITHSHSDHIGGLEEAALVGRYFVRKKPTLYICNEYKDFLWNNSLSGGCKYSEFNEGRWLAMEDFFDLVTPKKLSGYPRPTYETNVGSINLKIFRTKHLPDTAKTWDEFIWSTGILVDDKVMFPSDTMYDPELLIDYDKLFNLEAIFHDTQFFTGGVHSSLEELKNLPADIKAKTLLVHYGDTYMNYKEKIKEYGFADFVEQWHFYNF